METQPMKMASIEALWYNDPEEPGSPFSLLTLFDASGKGEIWSLRVPRLLSLISCFDLDCEVLGVEQVQEQYVELYGPGDYVPLMVLTYWGFRTMFYSALLMIGISALVILAMLHETGGDDETDEVVSAGSIAPLPGEYRRLDHHRGGQTALDCAGIIDNGNRHVTQPDTWYDPFLPDRFRGSTSGLNGGGHVPFGSFCQGRTGCHRQGRHR